MFYDIYHEESSDQLGQRDYSEIIIMNAKIFLVQRFFWGFTQKNNNFFKMHDTIEVP